MGISRSTADKWIKRYEQGGVKALEELSRAPYGHPNATPEEIREMIIAMKLNRQSWGPKKVLDYLREKSPALQWPADSTAGEILKRAGGSSAVCAATECRRIVNRLGGAKDPIRSGVLTSREIFFWVTLGAVIPLTPQRQLLSLFVGVPGLGAPELRGGAALV